MGKFAQNTSVAVDKSKAQIEKTLSRYGATGFIYGWDQEQAMIRFQLQGKFVCFNLILPKRDDKQFTHTPTEKERSAPQAEKAWEQACRSSWRALNLVIHAKLEAVEAGITTFEEEFLAHIQLPNGKTAGEVLIPQIETAYQDGKTIPMLPFSGSGRKRK